MRLSSNAKQEETFGGDGYVFDLDVVIVSWIYAYVQIYPIVYTKYVQFFISIISQ